MGNFHFPFGVVGSTVTATSRTIPPTTGTAAADSGAEEEESSSRTSKKEARRRGKVKNSSDSVAAPSSSTSKRPVTGNVNQPPKRKLKEEKMTLKAISEWAGNDERLRQLFYRAFFVGTQLAQSEAPGGWADSVQSPNKIMRYMQEAKQKECMGEIRPMLRNLENVPSAGAITGNNSKPVPMFTASLSLQDQEHSVEQDQDQNIAGNGVATSAAIMNQWDKAPQAVSSIDTISRSIPSPFQTQEVRCQHYFITF